ncbi:MAG: hypothetical protein LBP64_11115 [Tannerella sp.]|nr:hypothetical protein [Tannerella sp.]
MEAQAPIQNGRRAETSQKTGGLLPTKSYMSRGNKNNLLIFCLLKGADVKQKVEMNKILKASKTGMIALYIVMMFSACGEKKLPESIVPIQTEIEGDLSKQYVLVEKDCYLSTSSNSFTFEVKRTDAQLPGFDRIGVGIEIFDKDGKSIVSQKPNIKAINSWNDMFYALQLQSGEYKEISINITGWPDKLYDAHSFKIIIKTNSEETDQSPTNTSISSGSASSNSEDWDAVLKSYESYIDQYVKLIKKVNSGDMSAMTEYAKMLEKAEDLQNKLENAKDELSATQASKLLKLQTKLANAVSGM